MSLKYMIRALECKVGSHMQKLVLIKLADNSNDNGECWPSLSSIADICEISKRSAINSVKALEEKGILTVVREKTSRELNKVNRYKINLGGEYSALPSETRAPRGGEPIAHGTCHSFETTNEPIESRDLKSPRIKIVDQVIDYYHEILTTMPKIKKVTKTRIASINARHKEDLNNNIENWPDYFNYIKDNCTWMLDPKYGINFDYLINQTNYVKILEGTKNDR